MLQNIDHSKFQTDVLDDPEPKIVLFHATWCGFCSRLRPLFENKGNSHKGNFFIVDISNEESPIWDTQEIQVVPTMVIYKCGKAVFKRSGMLGNKDLESIVREYEKSCL